MSPWNEFRKCNTCNTITGLIDENVREASLKCPQCGAEAEFYHQEDSILHRANRGRCVLLLNNEDDIVGFLWGWRVTPSKLRRVLRSHHFHLSLEMVRKYMGVPSIPQAIYIDDVGVLEGYRGGFLGFGELLRAYFNDLNYDSVVFWTSRHSYLYTILQYTAKFMKLRDNFVLGRIDRNIVETALSLNSSDRRAFLSENK